MVFGLTAFALIMGTAISPPTPTPRPRAAAPEVLGSATLHFAVDLYNAIPPSENLIFSPINIATASAMLHAGARGSTAEQMEHVFVWEKGAAKLPQTLRSLQQDWQKRLKAVSGAALSQGNGVWVDSQKVALLPQYTKLLSSQFAAPPLSMSFAAPEAVVTALDAWLDTQTQGHITHLLEPAHVRDAVLLLASVMYFKAPWGAPFGQPKAGTAPFTLADGSQPTVPMLIKTDVRLPYVHTPNYEGVQIPYAVEGMALVILLPATGAALAPVSLPQITEVMQQLKPTRVDVQLPKFNISAELDLGALLSTLGMHDAFTSGRANFTGMSTTPLVVGKALHRAIITVDEKGTEAAAATAYGSRLLAMVERPNMVVNRPFLFLLRDTRSGVPLLMGRVVNPQPQ